MRETEKPILDPEYWRKAAERDASLKRAFMLALENLLISHIHDNVPQDGQDELYNKLGECHSVLENLESFAAELGLLERFRQSREFLEIYLNWLSEPHHAIGTKIIKKFMKEEEDERG